MLGGWGGRECGGAKGGKEHGKEEGIVTTL